MLERLLTSVLVLVLGFSGAVWQPPDAGAVVVCQRKKKVRLRAESCKEKETPLFDSREVGVERERVNAHDARLDEHEGRIDEQEGRLDAHDERIGGAQTALGQRCEGDPTRRPIAASIFGFGTIAMCRTLDDDPEACGQSFEVREDGVAASCVHLQGNCLGCDLGLHATGVCQNACQEIACADASLTGVGSCSDLTSQVDCEQSWRPTGQFPTFEQSIQATPCHWNAGDTRCEECGPRQISDGLCQNTCLTPDQFPLCRAEGRTYGDCGSLDGNESACNTTYELTLFGTATCFYDGNCEPCDPLSESEGDCTNDC
jgi:hypothetical protein